MRAVRGGGLRRSASAVLRLGTPAGAAMAMTGTVALYLALVAFGNITDFATNQEYVRHVLSMDTTFKDPDLMWRAVTSSALQDAAYVVIIAWETATALLLCAATVLWALAGLRGAPGREGASGRARRIREERARRLSAFGLVLHLLLFGAGFLAIGGEWFSMWQSKDWNGVDAAIRNVTLGGFALVLVQLTGRRRSTPAGRYGQAGGDGGAAGEPNSPAPEGG